jgi:hypothetical protein
MSPRHGGGTESLRVQRSRARARREALAQRRPPGPKGRLRRRGRELLEIERGRRIELVGRSDGEGERGGQKHASY